METPPVMDPINLFAADLITIDTVARAAQSNALDSVTRFACGVCAGAGLMLVALGAGMATGGDDLGKVIALAGALVLAGGGAGGRVMEAGRG